MIVGALAILALLGGVLLGGVFTVVLIPLAILAGLSAAAYLTISRVRAGRAGGGGSAPQPLPHSGSADTGHVRTSPERLADARRATQ